MKSSLLGFNDLVVALRNHFLLPILLFLKQRLLDVRLLLVSSSQFLLNIAQLLVNYL